MVYRACASTGDTIIYDSYTPGGKRFLQHAIDPTTLNKIASQKWDFVALQAQSVEPALDSGLLRREVFPPAKVLCDSIKSNYSCSQPLFYMTWGRKNGYPSPGCNSYPWICTYNGMDSALNVSYKYMADTNHAEVSPVGAVWHYIRNNYPAINLYSSDESHPSVAGSYAAACTFYTMILKKDPTQISWNSSLSTAVADSIKMAAKRIAFDSIQQWNYSEMYPTSSFSFTQNTKQVTFTNQSQFIDSLQWNFGDGNFSTQLNPIHNYINSGSYKVMLTVFKCNQIDSISDSLTILTTGLQKLEGKQLFSVYPNPTTHILRIKSTENISTVDFSLFDQMGRELMSQKVFNFEQDEINVSFLPQGIYYLRLKVKNNSRSVIKVIKQ